MQKIESHLVGDEVGVLVVVTSAIFIIGITVITRKHGSMSHTEE